jgi:hypothetical protein
MLVLSGVFNTRILVATNYTNQDYMRVNDTLIVFYTIPSNSNLQPIKKRLRFLPTSFPVEKKMVAIIRTSRFVSGLDISRGHHNMSLWLEELMACQVQATSKVFPQPSHVASITQS